MRALVTLVGLFVAVHVAHAETVVVLAGQGGLDSALRVAMAGRGIDVTRADDPAGEIRFERAAAAQHAAVELGAAAAVWIDEAEVCAVSADGHELLHAPYPIAAASPRTFAAIATSLLDEMMESGSAQSVDVRVNVDVDVAPVPLPVDAPGVVLAREPADVRAHQGHVLFEIGGMASPLTAGVQAALATPISPAWRVAVTGAVNRVFDGSTVLGIGSLELRHVGLGATKHWDIGPETGYATDGKDPAAFAGVRIARTWELSSTAMSLAFTPLLVHAFTGTDTPWAFPAIYASLRWQVPL